MQFSNCLLKTITITVMKNLTLEYQDQGSINRENIEDQIIDNKSGNCTSQNC